MKLITNNSKLKVFGAVLFLLFTIHYSLFTAYAQGTEFTYQGRLLDNALPPTANYDFEFSLWDSLVAGTQQGTTQTALAVGVANGIFTVRLNFGAQFSGPPRFLQIAMRPAGGGAYTTLAPRQPITSAPYSVKSLNADTASIANNSLSLGGVSASNFLQVNGDGSQLTNISGAVKWNVVTGNVQAQPNNGYFINALGSPTEIAVNLPLNPQIGDVLRVSGNTDWRLTQNAGQRVVRSNSASSNSTWILRATIPFGLMRTIASSADGSKLVASNASSAVYTSTDYGFTWTNRLNFGFLSLASSADGTMLAGAVNGGQIYTSTDSGVTWTPRGANRPWLSVASSADGTKLVAVVLSGQIYTSTDSGVNWTPRETNRGWLTVASSADGSKLVAAVQGGQIYTSTDSGLNWTPRETNRNWSEVESSADGTRLVAAVQGFVTGLYFSEDSGVTWTFRAFGSGRAANFIDTTDQIAISYTGKTLFVGPTAPGGLVSTDYGVTWSAGAAGSPSLNVVASSADGRWLLAANDTSPSTGIFSNQRDATKPGLLGFASGGRGDILELLYHGGGEFLITNSSGDIKFF